MCFTVRDDFDPKKCIYLVLFMKRAHIERARLRNSYQNKITFNMQHNHKEFLFEKTKKEY